MKFEENVRNKVAGLLEEAGRTAAPGPFDDNFSAEKENFIAP